MKQLDTYNELLADIFKYFGYTEGWRAFPLDDAREYFWKIKGPGTVRFAETEKDLANETGQYYENEIYPQPLSRVVYRGADYTMIVVDTHTDGNKFLRIFTNANER